MAWVGQPLLRREDLPLLTGRGRPAGNAYELGYYATGVDRALSTHFDLFAEDWHLRRAVRA